MFLLDSNVIKRRANGDFFMFLQRNNPFVNILFSYLSTSTDFKTQMQWLIVCNLGISKQFAIFAIVNLFNILYHESEIRVYFLPQIFKFTERISQSGSKLAYSWILKIVRTQIQLSQTWETWTKNRGQSSTAFLCHITTPQSEGKKRIY